MGPAKVSQTIKKIRIKGFEDRQHHEDIPSSTKKRKISESCRTWTNDELMCFYKAYHRHGTDWKKISTAVGHKSTDMVKALYTMHQNFLSLPKHQATSMGFIALVTGHHNVLELYPSHSGQIIRASGKAKKHGEATKDKVHEAPHPHDSYHAGTIPGFSPSFKKRYYGELASNSQSHSVGNRTPRIPVIVPTYRNAAADATPEFNSAINSTKRNNYKVNNDHANFSLNECSLDGRSGFMEATKGVECQVFLETKGTGDTEICQTQQPLKKRTDQTTDSDWTSKVGHEIVMEVKEGDKAFGLLTAQHMFTALLSANDMLILDVLQSLVNAPDKMSKLNINISSGKECDLLSERKDEGHSPVDLSNMGSQPMNAVLPRPSTESVPSYQMQWQAPAEEINVAHAIDITEGSLNSDSARGIGDLLESTENISCEVYPNLPREINPEASMSRRRKMKNKMHSQKSCVSCNEGSDKASKLLHCLSSESLRRWCSYEWFYSAVDFHWFMDNEFVKYLNHPYLRHISRLARLEWSIIRSYCGKPRRFSDNFLVVERKQLEDYRKGVREYYARLSDGSLHSVPGDVSRPFSIGQQVIVRHPTSRELCDGEVVMVEQDCCKVQFYNAELGVDLIKDIDCMPVNWLDNVPDNVRNALVSLDVHNILDTEYIGSRDHTINGVSIPELPNSLDNISDEQLEGLEEYRIFYPLAAPSINFPNTNDDHHDQLELYCSAFVQSLQLEARDMVGKVMQATSGGNGSEDEEAGAGNQASNCTSSDSGVGTCDAQLPSNLIINCIAAVLAIKRLADSRHPPANTAGILERFFKTLRPTSTCSANLAIYRDVEKYISIITSQTVALVPRTL